MSPRRFLLLIALLAAAAGVLRVTGLGFGFPYFFHPDEATAIRRVLVMQRGDLNPHWFSMPSFYLYLLYFSRIPAEKFLPAGPQGLHLLGRIWAAALGTLTLFPVYAAGRRLYGRRCGLLAAVLLATVPLHVLLSHYATVDVPATCMVAFSLWGAAAILTGGGGGWYLAAGAAAGLAAGTKYNAGFVLLPVIAAHFLAPPAPGRPRRLVFALGAAAGVFLLSTPFLVGDLPVFWRDLAGQSAYLISKGHGPIFIDTSPGIAYQVFYNFYYAGGTGWWLLVVAGVTAAAIRRRRSDLVLLAFVVPYLVLISIPTVKFIRFLLPLVPALCVAAGGVASSFPRNRRFGRVWTAAVLGVGAWMLLISAAYARMLAGPDPREAALEWMLKNLPAGADIGFIKTETGLVYLDDPPLEPGDTRFRLRRYDRLIRALAPGARPRYLVVTDFDYRQILRLDELYDDKRCALWTSFLGEKEGYRLLRRFRATPALGPLVFGTGFPPHDLKYNRPEISVFIREKQ
ncbi:MAG TPA: glycosyltransferase family 39 protein [bacterium]|nr:glycosyltransferase family 39 protein [bacterium]HPQ67340.1 glycosyltransferase family 39 protein [bacterium]